ncbi:MAG: hypothetical protein ACM359_24725 [Bacillota bacterium]
MRFVRCQRLRRVASEWRMGYAQKDPFNLARRIVSCFPVPDAEDLCIVDLIYCSEGSWHRYVFTAEYTRSADGGRWRERRVMTFCEPRDASLVADASSLAAAPEDLPVLDQYRYLQTHNWGQPAPTPNGAAA